MQADDDDEAPTGAPPWMATFADLMSLLLCFFVLLLSFSVMDAEKYKMIAGSMKEAFGVQRKVDLQDAPRGTSLIAQEFSPGRPDPTVIETIQQITDTEEKTDLSVGETEAEVDGDATAIERMVSDLIAETEADAQTLRDLLAKEIAQGDVEVETEGRTITVRISESASFSSGSATVNANFLPIMSALGTALRRIRGSVGIEGHTDNVPINTAQIRSNWDLSAKRALSVAHALLDQQGLDETRLVISGYADSRPRKSNDTREGRAANRRVEIVIRQPIVDAEGREIRVDGIDDALNAAGSTGGAAAPPPG
jgi:chemotaxis protein MotB